MNILLSVLIIYFIIALCFYISVLLGNLELCIQSKATGEYLDTKEPIYKILSIIFCICWIITVPKSIKYNRDYGDDDG